MPDLRLVVNIRRHHHQAANPHIPKFTPLPCRKHLTASIERKPIFRSLFGYMKFKKHIYSPVMLGRLLIDFLEQLRRVNRVNHWNIWRNIFHLVGLQMPNEMPLDVLREHIMLLRQFLLMAFAKHTLPCRVCRLDFISRMKLAHGNQRHAFRQSSLYGTQVGRNIYVLHHFTSSPPCSYSGLSSTSGFLTILLCSNTSIICVSATLTIT